MARTELNPRPPRFGGDVLSDLLGNGFDTEEESERYDEETRRISMALHMLETVLTIATRVESLNTSLLDRALKRYQALQTRDLDDRSVTSSAAEVTIRYPPSAELDNRLSRG